jgi:hypothetical protein
MKSPNEADIRFACLVRQDPRKRKRAPANKSGAGSRSVLLRGRLVWPQSCDNWTISPCLGRRHCLMDVVQIPMPAQMRMDCPDGHVAEWLRNGLQNRVPRFNSGRGLQPFAHAVPQRLLPKRSEAGSRWLPRATARRPDDPRRNPTTPREFCGVWRFQCGAAFVICAPTHTSRLFPGSSVVEQPAVNRLVAGSNPARGANEKLSS